MAYDLEEQEQLDTLKAWWKQYGNLVTWLLIIALSGYAAWTAWNSYQANQSLQASQLYEELQKSMLARDDAKVQRATADMKEKFSRTSYAAIAALTAAKSAYDASDAKTAKQQLQWVADNSSIDEYKNLAKLRLSAIALDEKAYDQGLSLLSGEFSPELAADVADRKGDIYLAQGKLTEARSAYQLAFDGLKDRSPARQLVQIKLEALGGSTEAASVAGAAKVMTN